MYFSSRSEAKEQLDNPELDQESLRKAYLDINRCNTMLGGTTITLNSIAKLIKKHPKKSYTIYDIGCGDGHMLRQIANRFENEDVQLNLVGIDIREDILAIARNASKGYKAIEFKEVDVLALGKKQKCDILLCTLTMHHFSEEEMGEFLKKFSELAQLGIIINDLERSKLAYVLFKFFRHFLIKTRIAKSDGLISIQKGFLKPELKRMATSLNELYHTIEWKWAFRYLWVMEPIKPT